MTFEIAVLFLLIISMIVVMALEILPTDTIALVVMTVLIVGGFVSPAEGIAGLSNPAVVTILCLMMLTFGLESSGVISAMGKYLKRLLIGSEWKTLLILLVIVGSCSALISTTAIVIVFMRILIKVSKKIPLKLRRYLMPLSFAGILGGSCTLVGTSTNLLVSAIAKDYGLRAFGMFEFTPLGICFFMVGLVYLLVIGRFWLPDDKKDHTDLTEVYAIEDYLTEVVVGPHSRLVGKQVKETLFFTNNDLDIIEIRRPRNGPKGQFPDETTVIQAGDILLIKGTAEQLAKLRKHNDLKPLPRQSVKDEARLNTDDLAICEIIVKPNS
ncbi:MAG: SLC13 family permease, partial [Bacteroidetes bacterium]